MKQATELKVKEETEDLMKHFMCRASVLFSEGDEYAYFCSMR
jgi:hypothetical protein